MIEFQKKDEKWFWKVGMDDHQWKSNQLFDSKNAAVNDLLMLHSLISTNLASCAEQIYAKGVENNEKEKND